MKKLQFLLLILFLAPFSTRMFAQSAMDEPDAFPDDLLYEDDSLAFNLMAQADWGIVQKILNPTVNFLFRYPTPSSRFALEISSQISAPPAPPQFNKYDDVTASAKPNTLIGLTYMPVRYAGITVATSAAGRSFTGYTNSNIPTPAYLITIKHQLTYKTSLRTGIVAKPFRKGRFELITGAGFLAAMIRFHSDMTHAPNIGSNRILVFSSKDSKATATQTYWFAGLDIFAIKSLSVQLRYEIVNAPGLTVREEKVEQHNSSSGQTVVSPWINFPSHKLSPVSKGSFTVNLCVHAF